MAPATFREQSPHPPKTAIDWTGLNERQFVIRTVMNPHVTRILSRPVGDAVLNREGGSLRIFPDFLIEIDGIMEIREVKPDAEYARPDVRRRLEQPPVPPSATDTRGDEVVKLAIAGIAAAICHRLDSL